jgi:hypothetical protein
MNDYNRFRMAGQSLKSGDFQAEYKEKGVIPMPDRPENPFVLFMVGTKRVELLTPTVSG